MKSVASDEENFEFKMFAYYSLGRCYNLVKEYQNAIKCFKKLLQTAWETDNNQEEVRAYE